MFDVFKAFFVRSLAWGARAVRSSRAEGAYILG